MLNIKVLHLHGAGLLKLQHDVQPGATPCVQVYSVIRLASACQHVWSRRRTHHTQVQHTGLEQVGWQQALGECGVV